MALSDQPKTTYSDTTPQRRAIADVIDVISPQDVPVVKYFGLDGDPGKFRIMNWPSTKVEWLEDELASLTGTLNGSITSNATTITVTDASKYKSGDIIEIDSEMIWVSSMSGEVLTGTRNYGGTQASHVTSSVVTIISAARLEGADADYERAFSDITAPYNHTQIFSDDVKVTRSGNKISQYGISEEFDYQAAKRVPELSRLIEKSFFRGQRKAGSATTPRAFGGLETFITDNTANLSSAALKQKDLEDKIQDAWEDGGQPDLIICNAWVKRKISGFYAASVRTTRDEKRGGVTINEVDTEFGTLGILMSRWCPSSKLYIVESQYIGFLAFDAFFQEELAKTGDSVKGQVVGEYGLVVKNDKAHAYIYGISTTK
jgi:hypothetical protein